MKKPPKLLIADDDPTIRQLIQDWLEAEGFEVVTAANGEEALAHTQDPTLSLIILDILMPGSNGLEICRKIRETVSIPILLLSAKNSEIDKVVGLEVGADDYITKPFSIYEFTARIKSHLRREQRHQQTDHSHTVLVFNDLIINKDTYEVIRDAVKIPLSTKEFQILLYMAENKNIVLNREQIFHSVWGIDDYGDLNTVTVYLKNIRKKLDPDHRYIKTVWGVGYKFINPE